MKTFNSNNKVNDLQIQSTVCLGTVRWERTIHSIRSNLTPNNNNHNKKKTIN